MKKRFFPAALLALSVMNGMAATNEIPRPEYPRPQFERTDWVNLNGDDWTYTFDFGKSGRERGLKDSKGFNDKIVVPFCPESPLSGVGHTDFIDAMWYHRKLEIPAGWESKRILLNFGGVDYMSQIYVDGKLVATHYGGSASFSVDITKAVTPGKTSNLVIYVEDDVRSWQQPGGKQSRRLNSYECFYTRVTGIWQTVWMEAVDKNAMKTVKITPDLDGERFIFEPSFYSIDCPATLEIKVKDGDKTVAKTKTAASNNSFATVEINNPKLWSPESPFLYDIEFTLTDEKGNVKDYVKSYAGMRKSEIRGTEFYLNNEPYYQRLVLDQGYYPDGQWTAPSDDQLRRDIELGKAAGFNGARLHQKVFEPRYLYWADKLGYLTWGESASWEMNWADKVAARNMLTEWADCVSRDYNSTSIVAWSPLNETWIDDTDGQRSRLTNDLYSLTKQLDRTRPVVTVSGGHHAGHTDIYAEHTYVQDPVELWNQQKLDSNGMPYIHFPKQSAPYNGECYMIDEFGGIQWNQKMDAPEVAEEDTFWGYGQAPRTMEEFYQRLEDLVNVILATDHIGGFCYTQIVDVELEKNGIYTYDRQPKFDIDRIKSIFSKDRAQAKAETEALLKKRGQDVTAEN